MHAGQAALDSWSYMNALSAEPSASTHARILESITRVRECWKGHVPLKLNLALYTAGSAIALNGAVSMLVLPHAVTAGASLYIEEENLIAGKPE